MYFKPVSSRDPRHNRRLRMIGIRRGSDTHSDFINKLIEAFRIIEFQQMTGDEFIIHLFTRDADITMGKIAQEVLKEAKPDVNNLVNRIQEYESESWYNPKQKEYGRMASSRPQRYCKGVIALHMMKAPAGEFAHIVT